MKAMTAPAAVTSAVAALAVAPTIVWTAVVKGGSARAAVIVPLLAIVPAESPFVRGVPADVAPAVAIVGGDFQLLFVLVLVFVLGMPATRDCVFVAVASMVGAALLSAIGPMKYLVALMFAGVVLLRTLLPIAVPRAFRVAATVLLRLGIAATTLHCLVLRNVLALVSPLLLRVLLACALVAVATTGPIPRRATIALGMRLAIAIVWTPRIRRASTPG
mmetsp:Transcript_107735/g.303526  ORF Transcript_107735/g.303526 Transcript_107735/m.303526 type:complete len:218 (+) Transcript_107735:602-1255(+)